MSPCLVNPHRTCLRQTHKWWSECGSMNKLWMGPLKEHREALSLQDLLSYCKSKFHKKNSGPFDDLVPICWPPFVAFCPFVAYFCVLGSCVQHFLPPRHLLIPWDFFVCRISGVSAPWSKRPGQLAFLDVWWDRNDLIAESQKWF